MIPHFTKTQKAIYYPDDRRAYLGIKPYMLVILLLLLLSSVGAVFGSWSTVEVTSRESIGL